MVEGARRLLLVEDLVAGYGKKQVLDHVGVDVFPGEIVALIGHNGAGKSTLLKAVFGMLPIRSGRVLFEGIAPGRPRPLQLLRSGICYVPQGNRVFPDLTVQKNLEIGAVTLENGMRATEAVERVLALFPALKSRLRQRAGDLSGGEKQMLALGNALVLSPRLLLLDEPSLGLAPPLVSEALHCIGRLSRDWGVAAMIVEQKVREVLKIARRVCVLKNGRVSFSGPAEALSDEARLREVYF